MIFENGERVAFTITVASGEKIRVNCVLAELGDIFCFLGNLAKCAAEMQDKEPASSSEGHNYLAPVPAQGMGFQAGSSPEETLLVMRLFGFDMAFSVSSSGLAEVADGFARTARTLSAGTGKRQ